MTDQSNLPPILPAVPPPQISPLASVSLIAGLVGWNLLPIIGSIVAIVAGHMALTQIAQSGGALVGRPAALIGLVLGYFEIVVGVCLICALIAFVLLGGFGNVFPGITPNV